MKKKSSTAKKAKDLRSTGNDMTLLAQMVVNAYDASHKKAPLKHIMPMKDTQKVTPKSILYASLSDVYRIDPSQSKFEEFMEKLMTSLSLLSTQGAERCAFGRDFNDLFQTFVTTLNVCACMKKKLDENGIEFDVQRAIRELMLGNDNDEKC